MRTLLTALLLLSWANFACASSWSSQDQHLQLLNPTQQRHALLRYSLTAECAVDQTKLSYLIKFDPRNEIGTESNVNLVLAQLQLLKNQYPQCTTSIMQFNKTYDDKRISTSLIEVDIQVNINNWQGDQRIQQLSKLQAHFMENLKNVPHLRDCELTNQSYDSSLEEKTKHALLKQAQLESVQYAQYVRTLNPNKPITIIPKFDTTRIIDSNIYRMRIGLNYAIDAQAAEQP